MRTCQSCGRSCWAEDPVVPNSIGCSLLGGKAVDEQHSCSSWEPIEQSTEKE